jgi:site-specific recombinase XerD
MPSKICELHPGKQQTQGPTIPRVVRRGAVGLAKLHQQFVIEQRFSTRLSSVTLRGYEQSFALLVTLLPTLTVNQLTPATMTEFFRRLEARTRVLGHGRTKSGVKTSTIATYRSKLNRFFNWLKAKGHLPVNPFEGMPYPPVAYEDRKYLGRAQVERIFSALVLTANWRTRFLRKRNIALFSTLLYTGMRKGELLGLRVTDVDLDRLEVTIRAETSKSRLRRVVTINSNLCQALEDFLEERQRKGLKSEYFFTSASGDVPFTANGLKHLVQQVKALSGVTFHVHQFRHTFAVNVLNNGGDIAKLKQLLGHRDIRMTSAYLRCLPTSAMRTDIESLRLDALL